MTTFNVPDMSCGHCKAAIENAVKDLDAAASVAVDLEGRTVEITATVSDSAIVAALKEEGFGATAA